MHGMIMKATRGILPRILHVTTDVIEPFNLDTGYTKIEIRFGDLYPIRWRFRRWLDGGNGHDLLRYNLPLMGVAGQRCRAQFLHLRHQFLNSDIRGAR